MIINLGLPKSGTTTFATALRHAGFRVADHRVRPTDTPRRALRGTPIARRLYDGYFHHGDPLAQLDMYDALSEISILRQDLSLWPQTDFGLIQTIRDLHPTAQFVLTLRPSEDMADSMLRWGNLGRHRMPRAPIPGLPNGYGSGPLDLIRFIEGHHAFVQMLFAGDSQFLALDIPATNAPHQLAEFVGRALPWWGRANQNPVQQTEHPAKD